MGVKTEFQKAMVEFCRDAEEMLARKYDLRLTDGMFQVIGCLVDLRNANALYQKAKRMKSIVPTYLEHLYKEVRFSEETLDECLEYISDCDLMDVSAKDQLKAAKEVLQLMLKFTKEKFMSLATDEDVEFVRDSADITDSEEELLCALCNVIYYDKGVPKDVEKRMWDGKEPDVRHIPMTSTVRNNLSRIIKCRRG